MGILQGVTRRQQGGHLGFGRITLGPGEDGVKGEAGGREASKERSLVGNALVKGAGLYKTS